MFDVICSQQHTFAWAGLDHTRPGTVLCDLLSDGMSQHLALELDIVCNGPNGNSTGMFAVPVTAESMSQHDSLGGTCGLQRFIAVVLVGSNGAIRPICS